MDLYHEWNRTKDYSHQTETVRALTNRSAAIHNISYNDAYALYVSAFTGEKYSRKIFCMAHRTWFCEHSIKAHIMCLDCDSELDVLAAARILKMSGIGYAIVNSNGVKDDRYWIITDFAGDFADVIEKMKTIPGVDSKYVSYSALHGMSFLRAYPKVVDNKIKPVLFPDSHTLTNPMVIKWYDEFKAHMESNDLRIAAMTGLLRKAKENGTLAAIVADPQFEI